jgi:hypothetical protein
LPSSPALALADYGKAAARRELAMDRGVKIAIFVACIAALSLGLIWDQVLSSTRNLVVKEKPTTGSMGPEIMQGLVGPQNVGRAEITPPLDAPAIVPKPKEDTPPSPPPAESRTTEYLVVENDSWWKIAEKVWGKDRAHHWGQIEAANPGLKLRAGKTVVIPPYKKP